MISSTTIPKVVDPKALAAPVAEPYANWSLGAVNDHEVRLSVMTSGYPWHRHPDSDETFLCVDGALIIEFEDGEINLRPGELITVAAGILHRTRPAGARSVNLTFERVGAATSFA